MRVEGPKGFGRSYALSAAAGEHDPAAIRTLVLKLMPPPETAPVSLFVKRSAERKGELWRRRGSIPSTDSSIALCLQPSP